MRLYPLGILTLRKTTDIRLVYSFPGYRDQLPYSMLEIGLCCQVNKPFKPYKRRVGRNPIDSSPDTDASVNGVSCVGLVGNEVLTFLAWKE